MSNSGSAMPNPNEKILHRTESRRVQDIIGELRFGVAGQISRLLEDRLSKTAITWVPSEDRRRGRPEGTWKRTFATDIVRVDVTWDECATVAADQSHWRQLTDVQCEKPHRKN